MAEATKFLAVAQRHRLAALWGVGLALGLRRGEALGLAWENVDLTAGRIKISQALYRIQGELVLEDVKTEGSAATIPLPRPLVELLKHHRKKQLEDRFRAGTDWQTSGLVFTTKLGAPIDPRNVNRMFAALCTKAGVRSIRVHDMRHSCATLLFALGVDAATVQRILRHSSITVTTSIYMEVIETVQREAVSRMDDLFGPRRSDNGS
ncbi:MAG: site-specific integrase [Kutzneria sp.]|nr:site-specific integrase [Kutzneria sp.]